jgi:cytochrome c peroxidase
MTRRQRRDDWDKFFKTLERDITGTQRRGFKIFKQLITKLDKEKNQCIRGKNGSREYSKRNKTVPEKVATAHTEDDTNRIPKQALQYKPKGGRNIGRPRKRWRDQFHFEGQGTGNTPNPS